MGKACVLPRHHTPTMSVSPQMRGLFTPVPDSYVTKCVRGKRIITVPFISLLWSITFNTVTTDEVQFLSHHHSSPSSINVNSSKKTTKKELSLVQLSLFIHLSSCARCPSSVTFSMVQQSPIGLRRFPLHSPDLSSLFFPESLYR